MTARATRLLERLTELDDDLDDRLDLLARFYRLERVQKEIRLELPDALLGFLAKVMVELETLGRHDLVMSLELLYTDTMPLTLAAQLAGLEPRCPWLMHEVLPLDTMPRLSSSLRHLRDALDRAATTHGLPRAVLPWETWFDGPLSLGQLYPTTFFGGLQPLFGTTPAVLEQLAATPPATRAQAFDDLLGPAILHEFLHFGRDRVPLFPPYLDEALAGGLGIVFEPRSAFPDGGEALEGFLTFAQVGLRAIDTLGLDRVLLAQAGLIAWDELVPDLVHRADTLYWPRFLASPAGHLHPDTDNPAPFADLFGPSRCGPRASAFLALRGASMCSSRPGRVVTAPCPAMTLDFARGLAIANPPRPGAPATLLLHQLEGGPTLELPAGTTDKDLGAALDAAGLFDPS